MNFSLSPLCLFGLGMNLRRLHRPSVHNYILINLLPPLGLPASDFSTLVLRALATYNPMKK